MSVPVLVLACDMPGSAEAVGSLLAALPDPAVADGVIAVGPDGRRQHLATVVHGHALRDALPAGGACGRSVRSLLSQLHLVEAPVDADAVADIDTWEQFAAWERRLGGMQSPSASGSGA